jgi:serine/threonine protein kinase/formylglycine-generating enzyme required for sulfatase activity
MRLDSRVDEMLVAFIHASEAGRAPDITTYASRFGSREERDEFVRLAREYSSVDDVCRTLEAEPESVGSYRIERQLGSGGMGTVYEVWDRVLQRTLAMKVGRQGIGLDADGALPTGQEYGTARFLQEAQVTSQLRHPAIVPVHELGVDENGRVYFTMQLVDDSTLRHKLDVPRDSPERWPLSRFVDTLLRVCEATSYAHAQGVVHRDLKPENVMVGSFGEVYVMDWGLAKVLDERGAAYAGPPNGREADIISIITDLVRERSGPGGGNLLTLDGTVVGTPGYMAPEQAGGRSEPVGPCSDIYSVGAILYEILSGDPPSAMSPLGQVARDAPPELRAICERAMQPVPADRYATMELMRDDLRRFLDGRVVHAYEQGGLAELRKWVLRNKPIAALGAAALVLLAAWGWMTVRAATERALLNDAYRLAFLEKRESRLWPMRPELVGDFRAWLTEARGLVERRDEHARRGSSVELVAGLDTLGAAIMDVDKRLAFAETVEDATLNGPVARRRWNDAIAAVAAHPAYGGLRLEPRLGLLPLGPDPTSGYWEFVDLQTGSVPERDPTTGSLALEPEHGMVFVLLPGGTCDIGSQWHDPAAPNYVELTSAGDATSTTATERDPARLATRDALEAVLASETLRKSVVVAPILVSKYEMTQAQWLEVMGENPSQFGPGSSWGEGHNTLLHPVEQVSWAECRQLVDRLGFDLPTEAEWEYAARGGQTTPWWTGASQESLAPGRVNLCDASTRRAGLPFPASASWPEYDDGYPWHAPVTFGTPNPFGLYNVLGNVFEWCRDDYQFAESVTVDSPARVMRGGSYANASWFCRSAFRIGRNEFHEQASLGLRPVIRIPPAM